MAAAEKRPQNEGGDSSTSRRRTGKKYNLHVAKTAAIWEDIHLRGDVTVGDRTYIGPGCIFYARNGPIEIGSENIFTENVHVVNKSSKTMVIGDQNIFETGAKIEAKRIADLNMFGAKCVVMPNVSIGSGCVITPKVQVINRKDLKDGTIIFGDNFQHRQPTVRKRTAMQVKRMLKAFKTSYSDREGRSILKKPKPKRDKRTRKGDRRQSSKHASSRNNNV